MRKSEFFHKGSLIYTGSAPGRMDVLGGVADYSGSLLLQKTIGLRTTVSIQERTDQILRIYSDNAHKNGMLGMVEIDMEEFYRSNTNVKLSELKNDLGIENAQNWSLYVAGCFFLLFDKGYIQIKGANIFIESDVPIGKGVSSSAALEVATLKAMEKALNIDFEYLELPVYAQEVENQIVGAPCGLMDQLAVYFGEDDKLLPIICQPASIYPLIELPTGLHFIGLDSGVKHSVAGDEYENARTAAFMGYSIIALSEGASKEELGRVGGTLEFELLPFKGYLANISVERYTNKYESMLSDTLPGADFLDKYQYSIDKATKVNPGLNYRLKACTAHPIFENYRIKRFKALLDDYSKGSLIPQEILCEMGDIFFKAHESYSKCGLGHEATDRLVEMVRKAGKESGVYGAKITGGGSGGTICVLAYGDKGRRTTQNIYKEYLDLTGKKGALIE